MVDRVQLTAEAGTQCQRLCNPCSLAVLAASFTRSCGNCQRPWFSSAVLPIQYDSLPLLLLAQDVTAPLGATCSAPSRAERCRLHAAASAAQACPAPRPMPPTGRQQSPWRSLRPLSLAGPGPGAAGASCGGARGGQSPRPWRAAPTLRRSQDGPGQCPGPISHSASALTAVQWALQPSAGTGGVKSGECIAARPLYAY